MENKQTKSKKRIVLTAVLISVLVTSLALVSIGIASLIISQKVTWNYQSQSFTVNGTSTTTLNDISLGTITNSGTQTLYYTVVNTGSQTLTITASDNPQGATSQWNATSATLSPGATAGFMLTLTITGQGSDTINFSGS